MLNESQGRGPKVYWMAESKPGGLLPVSEVFEDVFMAASLKPDS